MAFELIFLKLKPLSKPSPASHHRAEPQQAVQGLHQPQHQGPQEQHRGQVHQGTLRRTRLPPRLRLLLLRATSEARPGAADDGQRRRLREEAADAGGWSQVCWSQCWSQVRQQCFSWSQDDDDGWRQRSSEGTPLDAIQPPAALAAGRGHRREFVLAEQGRDSMLS